MHSKPSISIIGAGNVGYHLALALNGAGYTIRHIISRTRGRAEEAAGLTGAVAAGLPLPLNEHPELFLLCVGDDQIGSVAEQLRGTAAVVVHTSGSTPLNILSAFGGNAGVFYPVQTFTRHLSMDYSRIPFLLEANDKKVFEMLNGIGQAVSGDVREANSESRFFVHVAAVFACNFGNHMAAIAEDILERNDLDFGLLRPLVEQTFLKLQTTSPREAQTGPAIREDKGITDRHVDALREMPELERLYRLITGDIQYRTGKKKNL